MSTFTKEKGLKFVITTVSAVFLTILVVYAFTGPSANPPTGGGVIQTATNAPKQALYVDSSGRVGVTTTSPSYRLDVNGTFRATSNWSLSGAADTNLNMNSNDITAVDKLSVTTIDPLYEIFGKKYATYVAAVAGGVREEFVGRGKLDTFFADSGEYGTTFDFDRIPEGSDLWVWRHTVDFSPESVDLIATPYGGFARIYYFIRGNTIEVRADRAVEFSFRLSGLRFDWRDWPTYASDQSEQANLIVK